MHKREKRRAKLHGYGYGIEYRYGYWDTTFRKKAMVRYVEDTAIN